MEKREISEQLGKKRREFRGVVRREAVERPAERHWRPWKKGRNRLNRGVGRERLLSTEPTGAQGTRGGFLPTKEVPNLTHFVFYYNILPQNTATLCTP